MPRVLLVLLALALCAGLAHAQESKNYYTEPPQFHFTPDPDAPRAEVGRFGPIGLALELRKPNFTIYIKSIEEGSPAASTGKLKPMQIIESINGEVLSDIDPRVQLGNMITKIEAGDGTVKLMVKDEPKGEAYPVEFKIPALGAFSDTWPVDCPKSDQIVKNMSKWLREQETWGWGAALFLLSTGEKEDLEEVRRRFTGDQLSTDRVGHPWSIGYTGMAICEYYLRTGDKSVLPAIKARCDYLRDTIYNGSWMGRGGMAFQYMAGGHLNAAGAHCVTFMMLAKECGVDVDEDTMMSALLHLYRYSGRGNVAYGDQLPEGGMVDNGKTSKLAFAMQAAANLSPDGEDSVYAKARDISATKSFYSTSWLFHGHTGGGIGELWRGSAMGLVKDKRPAQYRSFMDERRWMYELARTHDGGFGWADGQNVGYTGVNTGKPCGNYIPLVYTLPRKKLRIFGAPATEFSQTYDLPAHPWGTPADEAFYSLEPGTYNGESVDVDAERLRTDASMPLMNRLSSKDNSDDELMRYALHIDHGIRSGVGGMIVGQGRYHLVVPLLKSEDPRARRVGLQTITGAFKAGALPPDQVTDEMIELAAGMVNDPDEAWWNVEAALRVLGMGTPDQVAPHIERLEYWLQHDEWWLRSAAIAAVTPLAADERYYKKLLPIVGNMIATNQRASALKYVPELVAQFETAKPEVQQYAKQTIGKAYVEFPEKLDTPGDRDSQNGVDYLLTAIARYLSDVPGGFDELYEVSKERYPDKTLPHLDLYMSANSEEFGPVVKEAFYPLMREQLIWQYVGNNIRKLEEASRTQVPNQELEGLVDLYQRVGVEDYNWELWGPAREEIKWDYVTFDPPETKLWEPGVSRYREVTWPSGAEQWMTADFDPQKAGWKTGLAPFAHNAGKLTPIGGCVGPHHFCGCGNQPNTFWENEVILMRSAIDLPAMKDGYAYRILVGGRSHVGSGDGSDVWINGERIEARRKTDPTLSGVGKRVGGKPWGVAIEPTFREQFTGDPVLVAATGFLKEHKSGVKRAHQAFWFEEMKMPPLGDEEILKALTRTPLKTAAWQQSMDDADKYLFQGKFQANEEIVGEWTQVGQVASSEEFDPTARPKPAGDSRFRSLHFKPDGHTHDRLMFYSDDMLVDLGYGQALKMTVEEIEGSEYLFVEAGGFKDSNMSDWTSPLYVYKRK